MPACARHGAVAAQIPHCCCLVEFKQMAAGRRRGTRARRCRGVLPFPLNSPFAYKDRTLLKQVAKKKTGVVASRMRVSSPKG